MPEARSKSVVVLGAGPAGLAAAWKCALRGFDVSLVERAGHVGGNAGSFNLQGLNVDFGSHRLHPACSPEVLDDIRRMLGEDLLDRPRHGRIRLQDRWLHFPLKPANLACNLPPSFLMGVAGDAATKLFPRNGADSFASVLERGIGSTMCREFYFPYARKIWGCEPDQLDAEQARRRVAAGSMTKIARKVLRSLPGFSRNGAGRFYYPREGFGQISQAYRRAALEAGTKLMLETSFAGLGTTEGTVEHVEVRSDAHGEARLPADIVLSTIPLPLLVRGIRSCPPEVEASVGQLRYRSMILIYLVLDAEQFSQYDAHYFPGDDIVITRMSEPKNYGLAKVPGKTVLCAELPCSADDEVWSMTDDQLGELVQADLQRARLPLRAPVLSVTTRRLKQAYPIYTVGFSQHLDKLEQAVSHINGLVTLGRQGLFAHDNTHHTLAMAYAATDCIGDDGRFDSARWAEHRRQFASHVVED